MAGGHFIDVANWKRREHYELYLLAQQPFFSVTVDVDVTGAWQRSRNDRDVSFSLLTLFALLRAVNANEPFRLRLRGDRVWLHDRVGIGPTVMRNDETFAFVRLDLAPTFEEFSRASAPVIAGARVPAPLKLHHHDDDLVYHSTLPWFRF